MKKSICVVAMVLSSAAFAQALPQFTGPGAPMGAPGFMSPAPGAAPGTFVQPQQMALGEQPAYAQLGAQGCYPRGYTGPVTGPIQANGIPAPIPMAPGFHQ